MDYRRIYSQLMKKRLKEPSTQQYVEKHHILPKSIKQNNIVVILSAREHFIAHALLVKIMQKGQNRENYYKMVYAFNNMNKSSFANKQRYINSHLYQLMKHKLSEVRRQHIKENSPTKDKIWITNLKQNRLINKNDWFSEGWLRGKVTPLYLEHYNDALTEEKEYHFINYDLDIKNKILPRAVKHRKHHIPKKQRQKKYQLAKQYLEQYKINGYKGVVQKFNYPYQYRSLLMMFKRLIPNQWKTYKSL